MTDQPTPRYGHAPLPMRRVAGMGEIDNVGDFAWQIKDNDRRLAFAIPSPTPEASDNYTLIVLPVLHGANIAGKQWGWNGNEDRPTLSPSVHTHGHWHGWVRDGVLVEA